MLVGYARVSIAEQNPYGDVASDAKQIVDMFNVLRSTVYGHLNKASIGARPIAPVAGATRRGRLPGDTRSRRPCRAVGPAPCPAGQPYCAGVMTISATAAS